MSHHVYMVIICQSWSYYFLLHLQAAYGSVAQGFGAMPGSSSGYNPAAFAQAGMSPYGQSNNNVQSGQKRDSGYDQVSCLLCIIGAT